MDTKGRKISIVSIGVSGKNQNLPSLLSLIEQESRKGDDLILLPEMCLGFDIVSMDCEAVMKMRETAKHKRVYIVFTIFRYGDNNTAYNSSILIDRNGSVAGIYDKAYPFWGEGFLDPHCMPGKDVPVFETDFGKLGIAICFDANFPDVFKQLSDLGAELVLYPSGYSAGMSLQAHAINHNFYIISSTLVPDCVMYDINGQEIYYQKSTGSANISRLAVDLDRSIFHFDLNLNKRDKLLLEHAGEIEQDTCLEREGWFTLRAAKQETSVRKLASEYGLEELTQYKKRKNDELNKLRQLHTVLV